MTNNFDFDPTSAADVQVLVQLVVAQGLWDAEQDALAKDGSLLADNLDERSLQTGFMLGAVRALAATRETIAAHEAQSN